MVLPTQTLKLHIFEERYKQLIHHCMEEKKPFGMPVVFTKGIAEYGTLLEVKQIDYTHADGSMDIEVVGIQVFQLLTVVSDVPGKLYSGAIVSYPDNVLFGKEQLHQKVAGLIQKLYHQLNVELPIALQNTTSYDLAAVIGLDTMQRYRILSLFEEDHRLQYLRLHISEFLKEEETSLANLITNINYN